MAVSASCAYGCINIALVITSHRQLPSVRLRKGRTLRQNHGRLKSHALGLMCIVVGSMLSTPAAFAHREDYIDETLVYETLDKREIEPEYWLDVGSNDRVAFWRHNVACEYGITDHWMIDARGSIINAGHAATQFDAGRAETRYRFSDEGVQPIDVAVSFEANTERNAQGKQEPKIEPRLILSKDFQRLNLTLNLPEEIDLRTGTFAFVPAWGFRYNTTHMLRWGCEMKYNTRSHEDSVVPQIWLAFPHDVTIKMGYSFGFNKNEEHFARIACEVGF